MGKESSVEVGAGILSDIPLDQIATNPLNPRLNITGGEAFADLVKSVKIKGVIVPIIVRLLKSVTYPYQLVVGERRFHAARAAGRATVPAFIRELTDGEAYEIMLIENLQRQDLTEREEANTFKAFEGAHGSIQTLSEKTGVSPRYIRARIAVLALPDFLLVAWEKGVLKYDHLEQFLKLQGQTERMKLLFRRVKDQSLSAVQMKKDIGEERIPLSMALFDVKKSCAECRSNSAVQKDLFGLGDSKKIACFDPKCFKAQQGRWLTAHWSETAEGKKYGTKGVRFDDEIRWNEKEAFKSSGPVPKKCLECMQFASLVWLNGKIRHEYGDARVCIGNKPCFKAVQKEMIASTRGKKKGVIAGAIGSGPRVAWHGEYFRNAFYKKRVPEVLAGMKAEDPKLKTLLVACLIHTNGYALDAAAKALQTKNYTSKADLMKKLFAQPYEKAVAPLFAKIVEAMFDEGQNVGERNGLGSSCRREIGNFLGINLAKEWAPTEEYFQKKTTKEILAFGKKSGLFAEPKVKEYLAKTMKKKPDSFDRLKKSELITLLLKSGVTLVGRVPDEIIKAQEV